MIVKQVPSKKATGSFGGLADYILDKLNNGEKIEEVEFNNCPFNSTEDNLQFIKQTQDFSQAKTDKTMHLIVSFEEGEKPNKEVLRNIEKELLKSLGMEEHQRLSVTHTNTNNFHIHIAINKIHPVTKKIADPYQSKVKLQKKASELEEKHKLKIDNHIPNWKLEKDGIKQETVKSDKAKDTEIHSGMDNLLTWIKAEALDDIKEVLKDPKSTLEDLHKTLAAYNLEIKPRGNGIVIGDKTRNLFIKASDVHRDLSKGKLTKRFGEFKTSKITTEPLKKFGKPKNSYWEKYKALSDLKRSTKTEDLKLEKLSRLTLQEALSKKYSEKLRRVQIDPFINKRDKYQARQKINAAKKAEFIALKDTFATKRKEIYSRTNQTSYKEYLIEEALKGDVGALQQLRKQKQTIKPNDNVLLHPEKKVKHNIFKSMISKITKQGNAVYELGGGKIIDKGDHLKLSIEKSDETVLTALKMAIAKYGTNLDVQGNIEFKKRILIVSEKHDLGINFSNATMKQIKEAGLEKQQQDIFKVSLGKHILSMINESVKQLDKSPNKKSVNTKIKKLCSLYSKTKTNASLFEGDLNTLNISKNITDTLKKIEVNIPVDSFIYNENNKPGIVAMNKKIEETLASDIKDEKTPKEQKVKKELLERFKKFKWVLETKESIKDITVSYYRNRGVDIEDMLKEYDLEVSKLDKKVPAIDYSKENINILKNELTKEDDLEVKKELEELERYLSGEKDNTKLSKVESIRKVHLKGASTKPKEEVTKKQGEEKQGIKR